MPSQSRRRVSLSQKSRLEALQTSRKAAQTKENVNALVSFTSSTDLASKPCAAQQTAVRETLRDLTGVNDSLVSQLSHSKHERAALDKELNSTKSQLYLAQEHVLLLETKLRKLELESRSLNHALAGSNQEKTRLRKRNLRLIRDKKCIQLELRNLRALSESLDAKYLLASDTVEKLQEQLLVLQATLEERIRSITKVADSARHRNTVLLKRLDRAKRRLREHQEYGKQAIWNMKKSGVYSIKARQLLRKLCQAGCAEENVSEVIHACAAAMNVHVLGTPSPRTVSRAKKEGGIYSLIQNGREIIECNGFGESNDSTAHRQTSYTSVHTCLRAPTYAPNVDDTDPSTWTQQMRFIDVSAVIDHSATSQLELSQQLADQISNAYNKSPLARRDNKQMERNDYIRKQIFQNKDHAADGKKAFRLNGAWKKDVLMQDLGLQEIDKMDLDDVFQLLCSITDEEVQGARLEARELDPGGTQPMLTSMNVLEKKLGTAVFHQMSPVEQGLLYLWVFGGCCGHKDLNAFKYGVTKMMAGWTLRAQTGPVLLANKANDATIQLGTDADSAAVQRAIETSDRGGVKLASLAGALFNHKTEGKGYQDIHRHYISKRKLELHNITDEKRFPDTSNTRYQSHSYAAGELFTFHAEYLELLEERRDSKTKVGYNHLEENVAKGLSDTPTITELAAMAIYGNFVSWPYLREVRGTGDELINLLDLGDLHQRLPVYCDSVASNPALVLDTESSFLPIDGLPCTDMLLHAAVQLCSAELPDLKDVISDMFSGAAEGWRQFTTEFHPGGTFDLLTEEQRSRLFIPSTNDANEGGLGSWRVHVRYHPNSTVQSFSSQTRYMRNNTEAFMDKLCNEEDHRYVIQAARIKDASGEAKKFREQFLTAQRIRAEQARSKQMEAERKRQAELARLGNVGLIVDRQTIEQMTVTQLGDQLSIHKKILNDKVLQNVLQKDLKNRAIKLSAVLAAITRNEETITLLCAVLRASVHQAQVETGIGGVENN